MDKPLTLGKLINDCANGAYAGGDTFISTTGGHELYFNGHELEGIEKVPLKSTWHYVEKGAVV